MSCIVYQQMFNLLNFSSLLDIQQHETCGEAADQSTQQQVLLHHNIRWQSAEKYRAFRQIKSAVLRTNFVHQRRYRVERNCLLGFLWKRQENCWGLLHQYRVHNRQKAHEGGISRVEDLWWGFEFMRSVVTCVTPITFIISFFRGNFAYAAVRKSKQPRPGAYASNVNITVWCQLHFRRGTRHWAIRRIGATAFQ